MKKQKKIRKNTEVMKWHLCRITNGSLTVNGDYDASVCRKKKKFAPFEFFDKKEFEKLRAENNVRVVGNAVLGKRYKDGKKDDKTIGVLEIPYAEKVADKLSEKNKGVSEDTLFFPARVTKPKERRCIGYVYVGSQSFIRLQKRTVLLPLLLLVFIVLGASVATSLFFPSSPINPNNWVPVIDSGIGNEETTEEQTRPGTIQVNGFTEWSIPAGKKDNLKINLYNPEGNRGYFTFTLKLADTGEVLYQSNMVPPGEKLTRISLNKALPAGDYDAVLAIQVNELQTGAQMNGVESQITIHAK